MQAQTPGVERVAPSQAKLSYVRVGEQVFKEVEKIVRFLSAILIQKNAELFTLTYGAIVTQLIKDYEDLEEVNTQLEKMLSLK